MFSTVSMTGVGAIVSVIEMVAKFAGLDFPEGTIGAGVNSFVGAVGFILMIWGQLKRKDLKLGLLRKIPE